MSDETVLRLERILDAPRELVFRAWTEPAAIRRWWGGWAESPAPEMEAAAVVGGSWRFAMAFEGSVVWACGRYLEVEPPSRLAFTFGWEGQGDAETPVTLDLEDLGGGRTLLTLTHDLSLGANACVEGWDAQLAPLALFLAAG